MHKPQSTSIVTPVSMLQSRNRPVSNPPIVALPVGVDKVLQQGSDWPGRGGPEGRTGA